MILEKVLSSSNTIVKSLFCEGFETYFYPMVVITDVENSILEKDECTSLEVKNRVIRADNLRGKISEINKAKTVKLSEAAMKEIAEEIIDADWNFRQEINNENLTDYANKYEIYKKRLEELGLCTSRRCTNNHIMIVRIGQKSGKKFWGCTHFECKLFNEENPCKYRLPYKKD